VNKRHGENGDRSYTWVGVTNAPTPVKEIAREAARRLESEQTIIGWDVVHGEEVNSTFIFEGNTCPGTNTALAQRNIDQVEGRSYARTN